MSTPDPKEDALAQELLEALAFEIGPTMCDVGHPGGLSYQEIPACDRVADFTLSYHICDASRAKHGQSMGAGYGTWCSWHLAQYTTNAQRTINAGLLRGIEIRCMQPCTHVYRGIPDAVWNVKPLS